MEKNDVLIFKRYIKEISAVINCPKREKRFFMRELKGYVSAYVANNPDCTLEALYAEFGSPEQFANDLITRDDYEKLLKKEKTKATVWKWVAVIAAVIAAFLCMVLIDWLSTLGGTYSVNSAEASYYTEENSRS